MKFIQQGWQKLSKVAKSAFGGRAKQRDGFVQRTINMALPEKPDPYAKRKLTRQERFELRPTLSKFTHRAVPQNPEVIRRNREWYGYK